MQEEVSAVKMPKQAKCFETTEQKHFKFPTSISSGI